jgi:adenosylmethionine-8-amino-7-oxononanoate aminotransferase
MNTLSWKQRDLNALWHPCTQMKDHEWLPLVPVERGEGIWLYDFEGRRYLDAISSWWVNLFGHAHPVINQAIIDQLGKLEHVILAGFTHAPAIELAEKLVQITPTGLDRVFYTDNGSSAIEAAIKMSFHYWQNQGALKKQKFITLSNSYHGETLGALAVGDVALYKSTYGPLLMEVLTAPSPDCFEREPGESWEACSLRALRVLEALLEEHAETTCAILIEPLVQCAGGMRMYHPAYLTQLRALCDRYQIHLIADEIAVGFGRTGTLFACEQGLITPDFLCLSKGLTGGYLPLAALLTRDSIYQAFYDDYSSGKAFLHSHSYTGNPLACSAALATLSLFDTQPVLENNARLAEQMCQKTAHLNDHPHVAEVRQTGMILAIELVKNKARRTPYLWQERRGLRIYQHALEHEALLRPLGNVVYLMPPYVITPDQIDTLAELITDGIHLATGD